VLLVHRKKYDDWSLPKGKQEPGEPLPLTAAREVLEEGGARLILGRRLSSVRYHVNGRPKRVHYWTARVSGTDEAAVPNAEVDEVAWLTVQQARERTSYPRDLGVLDDFACLTPDTFPLIFMRHAKALPKSGWKRDDAARPLDDSGRADARTLAGLLASFAPAARVLSSPAVRCTETVRPYAELTGTAVRAVLPLDVSRTGGADSTAVIADAVVAGEPAVICAHRENMPALLASAGDMLGAQLPPEGVGNPLPTGGFWVLHVAGGALVAADVYDQPDTLTSAPRGRGGQAPAAQPDRDQGGEQHDGGDDHIQRVPLRVVVDRLDVVAREVAGADPGPDPQARAQQVVGGELAWVHSADAADDPVELAQPDDEPGDHHDDPAVSVDGLLGLRQVMLPDEHPPAVADHERAAREAADGVPDGGTDDAGHE
jgi:8-oxo-dGTP diphosphatase